MTTTSATATISSAGIGSGLDVNSIVTSLMAIERQPLTRLQTKASDLQTRLSDFGQIQSLVSGLHDASAPLFAASSFTLTSSGSSDPSSVSAGTADSAVPGTYSVAVSALSSTQSTVSAVGQFASATSLVGAGTLTVSLGKWAAAPAPTYGTLTAKSGTTPVAIAFSATDTLSDARDKINAANAGVTASLITDTSGTRLSIQSASTGADNGFRLDAADADGNNTDGAGLSRLAYDMSGTVPMTRVQLAADASATVNGIAVTSSTNTLTNVVDGVTFTLGKVTTGPVAINISRNTDVIKNQLKNFVSSYNTLHSFLVQQTKYDAATKTAALLQGDSTALGIQNQMATMLQQKSTASTVFGNFSSLGVQLQKDGSLTLNDAVATTALTNLPEITKALSTTGTGLAQRISKWTGDLLAYNGALPGKTQSIQSSIASNQKNQNALSDRLVLIEQRIRAQYTALDTTMSKANALSKFVTQQFSSNNSNSNSR